MADKTPDKREQELLAVYDRLDALFTNISVNLSGKFGGPSDQRRRLIEVRTLRAEVIKQLGYQPQSTLDKEIEAMKNGEDLSAPPLHLPSCGDPIFTGPRGGRYRYNSNGRKSYDV